MKKRILKTKKSLTKTNKKSYPLFSLFKCLKEVAQRLMQTVWNSIYRLFYPEKDSALVREEYGIPEHINLHITTSDGWFVATSPDLPGLVTEAKSYEDLLENINDAILTYHDVPKSVSDCVLDELKIDTKEGQAVVRRHKNSYQLAS